EVAAQEIAGVAHAHGAASLYDLGSGLLLDLSPWGLAGEPTVAEALASGVDAVVFSGDKLLAGRRRGFCWASGRGSTPAARIRSPGRYAPTNSRWPPWRLRWHCTGNQRRAASKFPCSAC